ncbi:MAG: carboxypeptidase regulatory-like domain-containing protein, partial [Desulfococcaceae bacterium]|nr:carboxypeptidase regulatory-like domain-containing protein [Desulfococcaceae bacterium]
QMDEIVLSDPEDDGIYEAVYDRFTGDGTYEINIFATDVNGYSSPPVQIFLTHQNENLYPDVYESDDTFPAAGNFSISEIRHHSFHDSGDTDIVKNYLLKGAKYKVSVENPAPACDPVIQVFRTEGNLYIPVTDKVNAYGSGKNESIDIICPEKGSYYVILSNASQNFGPDITYDLKIIRPEAGISGTVKGTVTAPSGMPIADAVITTDGGGSDMSRNDGSFSISDPVGNRVLTVEAAGYDLYQLSLLLTESEPLFLHIILCPASLQAGDINADEVIDLRDALLALQISAGQADFSCAVCPKADVNSDERLGLAESIFVLQVAGGL